MTKASDNVFPRLLISEGGSTSTPASGNVTVYAKANGLLYAKDDAGTETALGASSGLTDPMTTRGDIIVRNASNVTARLALGSSGKVLSSNGTDISWQTPSSGGITQAYAGYNTVGGSFETVGANYKAYATSFTLANDCLVTDVEAYIQGASANTIGGPVGAVYTDAAGSPGYFLAGTTNVHIIGVPATTPRWIGSPIGMWLAAGTYWAVVRLADTGGGILPQIAYDTGTDQTLVLTGANWPAWASATTTARQYSIRLNTIR